MHRRRVLVALLASAVLPASGWPQPRKPRRIGYLAARLRSTPSSPDAGFDAFIGGLRDLGYVEGRSIAIEWRSAENDYRRIPPLAAELVRLKPDLIATHTTPGAQALQRSTKDIPIVFMNVIDPVGTGLVASLARPGGNLTGTSNMSVDLGPKQLELLKAIVPNLSRVALLFNPDNASHPTVQANLRSAAPRFGVEILPVGAATVPQLEQAFVSLLSAGAQALVVPADSFFLARGRQIGELALRHRLPCIFTAYEDAAVGSALMTFGAHRADNYRRAAVYVDKILNGARPADLPVEQPTKFEFVINLKVARAIELPIAPEVLIRADTVIR